MPPQNGSHAGIDVKVAHLKRWVAAVTELATARRYLSGCERRPRLVLSLMTNIVGRTASERLQAASASWLLQELYIALQSR